MGRQCRERGRKLFGYGVDRLQTIDRVEQSL
jgi:hypothetical protein